MSSPAQRAAGPLGRYALPGLLVAVAIGTVVGCGPALRAAVPLRVAIEKGAPEDAAVVIDEQYVGTLGDVAARGVRLPIGEHTITVEKAGYFPWDKLVRADRSPIKLDVKLVPVPD